MRVSSDGTGNKGTSRVWFDVGEQEKNQPDSLSRRQAQTFFLATIGMTYPRVLADLLNIFPDYWDFAFSYLEKENVPCPSDFTLTNIVETCPSWEIIKTTEEAALVRSKLLDWAQQYGLKADWCLDRAIKTMQLWVINEAAMPEYRWYIYFDEVALHAINEAKQAPDSILHNWQALLCDDDLIERRPLPLPNMYELNLIKAMNYLVYEIGDGQSARAPFIETREAYKERIKMLAKYDVESTRLSKGKRPTRIRIVDSVTNYAEKSFDIAAKEYDGRPEWRRGKTKSIMLKDLIMTVGFQVVGKSYQELARQVEIKLSHAQ